MSTADYTTGKSPEEETISSSGLFCARPEKLILPTG
jgi:hypothetical protein